ncbi:hypothetical protein [Caballeronia temeraria]|uniref:hypothetical protein n=1 Tax=Caballeronia temeraria TaxID=1777137 RepID=UPI0012FD0087|nr:hypothetical protein [Caballeronia temeraria]
MLTWKIESSELHARRYHRQGRRPQARSVESIADGNGFLVKKNFIGEKRRRPASKAGCQPESTLPPAREKKANRGSPVFCEQLPAKPPLR